jgi:hypothetical protein
MPSDSTAYLSAAHPIPGDRLVDDRQQTLLLRRGKLEVIGRQGHRGDAARPRLLVKRQPGHAPPLVYLWATVDFPDPAGPHMKITRPMRARSRHKVTHSGFLTTAGITIAVN